MPKMPPVVVSPDSFNGTLTAAEVAAAVGPRRGGGPAGAGLTGLCDVRPPSERAGNGFGPQKGADPDPVRRLTRRLGALARRLPRDPRGIPLTGAAGGLSGGLWAAFGARL